MSVHRGSKKVSDTGSGIGRRRLLKTGAAGVLLAGAPLLRGAESSDVIVLGAGLAGLNSARQLEALGYRVTVLEAGDTVGGRVQTRDVDGVLHEMGASDVGILYARVISTARELGLTLQPYALSSRPFSYHIGGKMLRAEEWESADVNKTVGEERSMEPAWLEYSLIPKLNPLHNPLDWQQPEFLRLDVPLDSYLRSRGVSQAAIDILAHTYNGEGISRTSALSILRDASRQQLATDAWLKRREENPDELRVMEIRGGMQQLPEGIAANLDSEVRLNQPAALVEQDAGGVTVTCRNGTRYRARKLVCAMSLRAMRNLDFRPGLSLAKQLAVDNAEYYATTKFYLRPTAPFWEEDGYEPSLWSDGLIERIFARTDYDGNVHTLLVWINGQGARRMDKLSPEAGAALVMDELARIRPASKGRVEVVRHQAWGRNTFFGGCVFKYSAGQMGPLGRALPQAEGHLHFAGEHTRELEVGMEAAMASGERTALEIASADMA